MKRITTPSAAILILASLHLCPASAAGAFGASASAGTLTNGGPYANWANAHFGNVNVDGDANVDFAQGSLHARAWSSNDPVLSPGCAPYEKRCNWGISAQAQLWDTITLTSSESMQAGEEFTWRFHIDGSREPGDWWSWNTAKARYYFGADPSGAAHAGWLNLQDDQSVGSSYTVPPPGQSLTLYLMADLYVYAEGGAVTDYGNTMQFSWELPEGVSFTSASGLFMTRAPTMPVPEPSTWAMLLAGLGVLVRIARHRQLV